MPKKLNILDEITIIYPNGGNIYIHTSISRQGEKEQRWIEMDV